MSSYGQPPGRHGYDAGYDAYDYDAYDSYAAYEDSYAAGSAGEGTGLAAAPARGAARPTAAALGAAVSGRASVGAPERPAPDRPRPRYSWGAGGSRSAGRSVPVSPAGAASGRASVATRPARTAGPGGPGGPGSGGLGRGGGGRGGRPPARKKKRHWIRNTLLSLIAIVVIIAGGGMVALSYYVDSVPAPDELELAEGSTVLFNDGSEMSTLQEVNREIIDTTVPELANARNAVVAAEDQGFYDHSGVDFAGIIRAAWNNIRGGARQGGSTIDQQYARAASGNYEDSYARKLEEAAMAYKMNQEYSKEQILDFYLNAIYLGRGAYGIQAAAEAYFDKDAAELTVAEAALIGGVIRLPDDGSGLSPYDPLNANGPDEAMARWQYVISQMVDIGAIDEAQRAELEFPEVIEPPGRDEPLQGSNGPIMFRVLQELEAMGITDPYTGGYRITTTIDPRMQDAAVATAETGSSDGPWQGIPDDISAAMAAIDPETGAVRAYYGGEDASGGVDLAGRSLDPDTGEWYGGRPPGSTFKIYTLVAALRDGVSFGSHWRTSPFDPDWLEGDDEVHNAGRIAQQCEGRAPDYCTLRWSTVRSFNVPFAYYSQAVDERDGLGQGAAGILQAAIDAGIRTMRGTGGEAQYHDLTAAESAEELAPNYFFHPIAYGQYPITPLDHASGVATLAARGIYNEPHFVAEVQQKVDGEWVPIQGDRIAGEPRIDPNQADAITGVLQEVPGSGMMGPPEQSVLAGGRPAAAKTGTWEHVENGVSEGNADAWVVGYTPQLATAVWVGNRDNERIVDEAGNDIGSSGLPARIWNQFMNQAHEGMEVRQFPAAPPVGNPQTPLANGEAGDPIVRPPGHPTCGQPNVICPPGDGDDDRDRGRDGGGDGDGDNDGDGFSVVPTTPPTLEPPDAPDD